MTWRLRAGPGSFRGVPFRIEGDELGGGRKTVTHEFPLRDEPFVEDLGRRGRSIRVDAYLVGDDYIAQRDALIDALEAPGPGKLVLPYLNVGTRSFVAASFSVSSSRQEGGIAYITIEFLETTAEPPFPTQTLDRLAGVDAAARGLMDAATDSLTKSFDIRGQSATFLGSLSSVVISGAISLFKVLGPVTNALGVVTGAIGTAADVVGQAAQFAADIKRQVDTIVEHAEDLVRDPLAAADSFRSLFESLLESPASPGRTLDALLDAYAFTPETPPPAATTANRAREAANYGALHVMIQRMTLATVASYAPRTKFPSYEQAVATRERIADLLDEQIETADDDSFQALTDLRSALVQAVPGEQSDLPRLISFTPPTTLPSLVLAHRLYGHLDQVLDLVARNAVRHPGFVTGGRALEVLGDA